MSYEHGTDFVNLPQTVGTDKRDWFDTNEAFRDLDAKLRTAYEGVGTAEAQITELNTRVDNVQTVTQQNVEDISDLRTDLATTDERVAGNSSAIATLTTEVHESTTDLEDMIEVSEEASATAENAHAVGTYFRYNDNLWRTTVAIRVGDEIVPDVNCETTDVMTRIELLEGQAPTPQTSEIDDTVIALNKTWSSSKINDQLSTKCNDSKVGDLADLSTTDKTAIVNAINELYTMIEQGGGNNMKCAMFGTVQVVAAGNTIDISSLNLTSSEDYFVILSGDGMSAGNTYNGTLWIDTKTTTSFTIKCNNTVPSANNLVSYQVITLK